MRSRPSARAAALWRSAARRAASRVSRRPTFSSAERAFAPAARRGRPGGALERAGAGRGVERGAHVHPVAHRTRDVRPGPERPGAEHHDLPAGQPAESPEPGAYAAGVLLGPLDDEALPGAPRAESVRVDPERQLL